MRMTTLQFAILFVALALGWFASARAAEFSTAEYQRKTIYHSPQTPGFTSWVGAWIMPDGSLMVSFTQATGPVDGRPRAPQDVQQKLTWPPEGRPDYDMTGLDLRNVYLGSTDGGKTWQQASVDAFKSCMNGVQNWQKLDVPGTAYYPRAVQAADGRIFVFGHVGSDDPYGKVDQSIVMHSFRLVPRTP